MTATTTTTTRSRMLPVLLICMIVFVCQIGYTQRWRVQGDPNNQVKRITLATQQVEQQQSRRMELLENQVQALTKNNTALQREYDALVSKVDQLLQQAQLPLRSEELTATSTATLEGEQPQQQQTATEQEPQVQLAAVETTKKGDDIHHSSVGILDLQDWEIKTLDKPFANSCKMPDGITTDFCCLNAPAHALKEKKTVFDERRTQCDHVTLEDHQWMQQQAQQELSRLDGTSEGDNPDQCDVCRIVNLLHQHNLKFAFFGDSMMSQSANAFACELQRRNYVVKFEQPPVAKDGDGYRNFREIRRMIIESPTWQQQQESNNSPVVLDFIFQYRLPMIIPEQKEAIANDYDVLIVNFGHHWVYQPETKWERERYNKNTLPGVLAGLFNAIQKADKVQLLAWRENSASHFDSDGGDFSLARANIPGFKAGNSTCVPYYDHSPDQSKHAWREKAFQQSVQQTNYTLITAGQNMPAIATDDNKSELVVIPFYDFSSKGHGFHRIIPNGKQLDCLHFCYSPFLYLPIWKGIRLSMDRSFA